MKKLLVLFIFISITSCKDYYNEAISWMDKLDYDLSIDEVKQQQPDYIDIDWAKPILFNNEKWYPINKIKGNNDILNMQHFLVFEHGMFKGRNSIK